MKYSLLIFLICTLFSYGQENQKISYFPQEELLHKNCTSENDTRKCMEKVFFELVKNFLDANSNNTVFTNKIRKDTIIPTIQLEVLADGSVNEEKTRIYISNYREIKNDSIMASLKQKIHTIPDIEVINPKSEDYNSYHFFKFPFLVEKNQENDTETIRFIPQKIKDSYDGGTIIEIAKFKSCENILNAKEVRRCFNKEIQTHIIKNFKYPKEAEKSGLEGKVIVYFTISKKGIPIKIRASKNANKLFQDEGIRIVRKLPKLIPGKKNGTATEIPFAIPINFKLQ